VPCLPQKPESRKLNQSEPKNSQQSVANTKNLVCKPVEVSEDEISENEISEAESSDIEMEEEFQSAGSHISEEDASDDTNIQEIIQCLIDEAGLSLDHTTIKRSLLTTLLAARCFNYSEDELINELLSFGFLDTVSRRFVIFSDIVFDIPGLKVPAPLPKPEYDCDFLVNDCLYDDSDDMLNVSRGNDGRRANKKTDPEPPLNDTSLLRIEHNLTFSRLINRNYSWSSKSCIVCQKSFLVEMQLEDHLREVHGEEFSIPDHLTRGK
jgi:hypothetical protein